MTDILEVGQIQILPEFPEELTQLQGKLKSAQNTNATLAAENNRLNTILLIGGLVIGIGLVLYLGYKNSEKKE